MGKFLRRLFILLVLLIIAFLVYRYINPDGASKLVDKIKSIPDIFSSSDSSEEEELNITGTTLVISGDIMSGEVGSENGELTGDEEGMSWLEELNQEIEDILGSDDEVTAGDVEEDENLDFLFGDDLVETGTIEQETGDIQDVPPIPNPEENGESDSEEEVVDPELSDTDYQQVEDVFGNLVE